MLSYLRPAVGSLLVLSAVTGIAYPVAVTGIAQALFPRQGNGSLIVRSGTVLGSSLIGQQFADPKHFWGRPSATAPYAYNATSSGGSNLGPANPALAEAVAGRVKALQDADWGNTRPVPVDLVTAAASGLDPHISVASARYQSGRVAKARGMDVAKVEALVAKHTEGRQLGFLGEPRVNVLELNLDLDNHP